MELPQELNEANDLTRQLDGLSNVERGIIREVLERDDLVRKQHDDEFRNLKAEIEELQRARDAEIDFGLEGNACSLCMVEFGTFFGRGAPCPWCRRKVCTTCRLCAYVQQKRSWMCTLCAKEWQLRKFSGDWMEVGRKHRMSNSSTALFVLKSIMRMPCKQPPNQLKRPFLEDCSSKSSNSKRSPGLAKYGSAAEGERGNAAHKQPRSDDLAVESLDKSAFAVIEKMRDCIHHATDGILQVRGETMIYLRTHMSNHTGAGGPRPLSLSQESVVGQPDFDAGLTGSKDEFFTACNTLRPHDRSFNSPNPNDHSFNSTYPSHQLLVVVGSEKTTVVTSTPRKDSPHGNATFLIPNVDNHNLSFSSVASEYECHAVGSVAHAYGDVEIRVELDYELGMLNASVLRCRNLPSAAKSSSKMPDAYVKVYLCGAKGGHIKQKTKVAKKGFNPVYNETLQFSVTKEEVADWSLSIKVCYKDRRFSNVMKGGSFRTTLLGETTVMITSTLLNMEHPTWVKLHRN